MQKKQMLNLGLPIFLVVVGSLLLIFPLFHFFDVKYVILIILSLYLILNILKCVLTKEFFKSELFGVVISTIVTIITIIFLPIKDVPWYLAISLFIWVILISLTKLRNADNYNGTKLWIVKIISLIIFILLGLLSILNLYYESDIQILILGYFFLSYGTIELFENLTIYLLENK